MLPRRIWNRVSTLLLTAALLPAVIEFSTPAHAAKDTGASHADEAQSLSGPAVLAVVSLQDQRISVYDAHGGAVRANVSSGQTDYETPVGVYSILQKNKDHYSNLYDDAEMPFMQRLTWSGIALHGGALPGYPASHGCVRLPRSYAEKIFSSSKIGTRVIVARDAVAPTEITHPLLFKPTVAGTQAATTTPIAYKPEEESESGAAAFTPDLRDWPERQALREQLLTAAEVKATEAEAAAPGLDELKKTQKAKAAERAKSEKALRRAEKAKKYADDQAERATRRLANAKSDRTKKAAEASNAKAASAVAQADERLAKAQALDQAASDELAHATAAFDTANAVKTKAVDAAQAAKRKTLPVSVFVSLKTQRLYVRQGHEPVLDVPVTIDEPEKPIGTHVYTAVDYKDDGNDVRWMVVSLRPGSTAHEDESRIDRKKRRTVDDTAPPPTDLGPATAALDRVKLPPEIVSQVSEYVWPGSSLIVSDEELSKETGKATDFVVLISGEPQGGIKKRPKPQPNYYRYDPYYDDDYYYERRRRQPRYTPFFSFW